MRFDFRSFFIAGLTPILVFVVAAHTNWQFLPYQQSIQDSVRQRPQLQLVFVGIYYFAIGLAGILTTISLIKDKAKEAFEHKKSKKQPEWLSTRKKFVTCEKEIEKQTHSDSVVELEKAKMSGIEGGAAFVAIIILLFTLVAVLFTTLFYFMIGTTFNLVGQDDGFLFANNEGFTAAISLLVVLVAAAVVPVYTDLGKTISEQLNFFEEEISNISRNLLFIGQRMDPVWDHYQNITNRVIPEWFLAIDEELEENDSPFVNDLKASLRIDEVFKQATEKTEMLIEPFHENTFLALGQEFARLEPHGIFLYDREKIVQHDHTKVLEKEAIDFILQRLERLTNENSEVPSLEKDSLKKEIKNRRRYLAYQAIRSNESASIKKIENYFPPSEWEVSLLVGDEKPSKTLNSLYEYFGESLESYIGHHMLDVNQLAEEGDRSLSGLCLKSDISADIFLDDYHLFKNLRGKNIVYKDGDPVWSQNRAREIYYAIFFFASQDPESERSKTVRVFKDPNQKVETKKGQVFFEDLFSEICTSEKVKESFSDLVQEQLLLDLTYERSALHNWIRASQAVTRRRIWIELSNELSNKVETRKEPPSLWGLPIVPTRDRRLHDLMRHAGVPIIDKKRLRLLTLGNIVEEAGRDKTKEHIEESLLNENWVKFTRAQIIEAEKRSVKYNRFIEALQPTKEQIKQLKAEKTVWLEPLQTNPTQTAIIFWKYFLEKVDGESVELNGDDSRAVLKKMIEKLDTSFDFKKWIQVQLEDKSKQTYEDNELRRKLKFLDPMRDTLWRDLTDKTTKENLIMETLKIYTKKFVDEPEQLKEFRTVPSSWLLLFKRSLKLKGRPGIGRKGDILQFEMSKFLKTKMLIFADLELTFTDDELFIETLHFATIKFAENKNPFWGSVKESYLDRIRELTEKPLPNVKFEKKTRSFEVNGTNYIWRNDGDIWNIALESRHTPSDFASDHAEWLGVGTNWLEYSLQQCDKLGFTSVNRSYIVHAVNFWGKEIDWTKEEQQIDYKFLKPDGGSTTWTLDRDNLTRDLDKWTLTAHSLVVKEKNYIWRVAKNGDWNIALESMHTPSDQVKQDVKNSVENWLEYSLQTCANYGFTVVDDNYLKEAVAIWDEEFIWTDYRRTIEVNVMIEKEVRTSKKVLTSATWTKGKVDWVLGR